MWQHLRRAIVDHVVITKRRMRRQMLLHATHVSNVAVKENTQKTAVDK